MIKVLILGAEGMLGSACLKVFQQNPQISLLGTSRNERKEFLNFNALLDDDLHSLPIKSSDYVVNCIGMINQKIILGNRSSEIEAIQVNTLFPQRLARACEENNSKLIQIATDCVFSGKLGGYNEVSPHDPVDIYGKSKTLGEVDSRNSLNLRCSIVGKSVLKRESLLDWFLQQPKEAEINGYANAVWNGVGTLQFAKICLGLILNDKWIPGTFHLVPGDIVTKFELLEIFRETFSRRDIKISKVHLEHRIDRTLSTLFPKVNETLWEIAGYSSPPTILKMVQEMSVANKE